MLSPRSLLARALLPVYANGRLPAAFAQFVRAALERDARLARTYTALRRLERAIAPGAPMSAAQRDLIERGVLASMEPPVVGGAGLARWASGWAPLAAATACVAVFGVIGRGERDARDELHELHELHELDLAPHFVYGVGDGDDLAARTAALAQEPLGVKVTCVHGDRVVDSATAGARRSSDAMRCPVGTSAAPALLAFAVTNLSDDERWMFVVGVAGDGSARWYAPFDREAKAVRAAPGADNKLLPALSDMSAMPADERVTLHVLMSDKPFLGDDVDRQLDAARQRGVPLGSLEKLPLPDIPLQARVDMVRR